ncbi:hypothetical protein KIPB_014061, partial [Kipferlia bialata]|eukprot:g14061.t1
MSVSTLSHNTILAATENGQVDRYTVDPATLALTDVAQVVTLLEGRSNAAVYPVLVSGSNQTVLVVTHLLIETHSDGHADLIPAHLGVTVFHPDTGTVSHLRHTTSTTSPTPRIGFGAVVVGEAVVVVGGCDSYYETVRHDGHGGVTRHPQVCNDMWCLDLNSLDSTSPWRSVSIDPRFADIILAPQLQATSSMEDSVVKFCDNTTLSVSLNGRVSFTRGVFDDPLYSRVMDWDVAVGVGPFICLFGSVIHDTPEEGEGTQCVYMYDIVSRDSTQYMPLPFPDKVRCACMLNPTTMLVVQGERTLVVELDPELFERFTD